ncbi:MAG: alpha/beta fold hydrolase [Nitrosomonas sp.]|nr:MAG: alpha/beta fold hydrolase [Nitrosomonas sp.]
MSNQLALYCLPCAGASATMYLRWKRLLPSWIEVIPVELPGRGSRLGENPQENYRMLVDILSREIALTVQGSYVLLGHSMGALLAYGIAQQLHQLKARLPDALMVSGCAAPARQDSQRYRKICTEAALIADLSKQGGTPEEVFNNPELLAMTLDLLRIDYRVCGSFQYIKHDPLPVPIHCFGGRSDTIGANNLSLWQQEGSRAFTLDWFDGGHFFLRQSEEWFIHVVKKRLLESQEGVMCDIFATA